MATGSLCISPDIDKLVFVYLIIPFLKNFLAFSLVGDLPLTPTIKGEVGVDVICNIPIKHRRSKHKNNDGGIL